MGAGAAGTPTAAGTLGAPTAAGTLAAPAATGTLGAPAAFGTGTGRAMGIPIVPSGITPTGPGIVGAPGDCVT
jgi:hypothetical protein